MLAQLSLSMSRLLLSVLDDYNRQLRATLIRAEQQWPNLCSVEDERLSEDELEKRRKALLLAMAYLEQLEQLLARSADQTGVMAVYNTVQNGGPLNDSTNQ